MGRTISNISIIAVSDCATACAPAVQTTLPRGDLEAKPIGCELELFESREDVAAQTENVGKLSVGDTGFSGTCGYDVMIDLIRNGACEAGADAVYLSDGRSPDVGTRDY